MMEWTIPGTVLTCPRQEAQFTPKRIEAMFLGGDITLSQVVAITGLETHTIQNWVKRGFVTPPQNKKYSMRQLCRILNMNMLKGAMQLDRICALLGYVNGRLDDEADDIIDDSQLYFLFADLAARVDVLLQAQDTDAVLEQALESYQPAWAENKTRVKNALRIMLTAYFAAKLQQRTEQMLCTLL